MLEKKSFEKMFPNLAKELGSEENTVSVNCVRTDDKAGERRVTRKGFVHYEPDAIDFIRRCDTPEQAEEIVAFLEERGEIDRECAKKLRKQLKEKGVRSFGTKKEMDYYLRHGELQSK